MKLRSLAIVALLAPGFAACGKKDAPAPAPAAAAPATADDLIKTGIAHTTKVYQAIISTKGDPAALKTALEALPKVDAKAITEAVMKGGEAAQKTYAADLAALAKLAKEAAAFGEKAGDVLQPYSVGVEALLPNELATADGGDQGGELAGGADKEGAEGGEGAAAGGEGAAAEGEGAAAEGAEGAAEGEGAAAGEWALVNGEYEAVLNILEENAADPAAAAAAITKRATEADLAASQAVAAELKKLSADKAAATAWALGAGKAFHDRIEKLKADHPALFENETIAGVLKGLAGEGDEGEGEGGEGE